MGELASDVGPAPLQVGAILVFEPGTHLAASAVRDALADGFAASRGYAKSWCRHHRAVAGRSGSTIPSSTSLDMSTMFAVHRLATRRPFSGLRLAS
ncbi:MAG: hypothetical protein QOF30_273 [Acidimicrobiaceae bacterium]|nr:hypothetical protein [Acidimicrobiaceae bacterium]